MDLEHRDPLQAMSRNRAVRGVYLMVRRYLRHGVSTQSAALAFYLLFTLFPLMIFFSALLGLLRLNVASILSDLSRLLPVEVVDFIRVYLDYVGQNPSVRLLVFGLFFSLYFPMRATNTLMRAVRTAYHLGPPKTPVLQMLKTLIYTVLLIVTITAVLVLLTVGEWLLTYAVEHFGLPVEFAALWQRLRFPAMALLMYFALYLLYAMTQDTRQPLRNIYPGVLFAMVGWMVVSMCYSFYVENIASYSLFYGSIGTAIVLLMWLYLTAAVLIMGGEFNGMLISLRREKG
ncbi:MAG: YihY/virulence factor BrkB family protein [Dysosmobacter sp.]|nr:YihY/virulence factor BrkB family protein [Dysosmobacter sp.]